MQYCAFLRGVNVKDTNMKMKDVCAVFEKEGMQKVQSVLASGNIIFESDTKAAVLKETLEAAMSKAYSYDAHLFLLNKERLETIKENNPFAENSDNHIYVFLGAENIEKMLFDLFKKELPVKGEEATINKGYFYWQIPKGETLGSPFSKVLGRKDLKDKITSRNLNTIEKVLNKMK